MDGSNSLDVRTRLFFLVRLFFALWPCLALHGLTGCCRQQRVEAPSSAALNDAAATQPTASVDADDLFELTPRLGEFVLVTGEQKETRFPFRFELDRGDTWRLVIEGKRTTYIKLDEDDHFVITREDDAEEGVSVKYDPPLVMLPDTLDHGEPFEGKSRMTVTNLKDGSSKAKGSCTYTVELLAEQRLITPAGTFDVHLVKTTRKMKLTLATAEVTTITAYAPHRGMVAELNEQVTRPLGLVAVRKSEELRLAR